MLPVSLDCPFLVTPSVFSNVYLKLSKQYFSYIHDKNKLTVYMYKNVQAIHHSGITMILGSIVELVIKLIVII
jgi:hypothetical protein